MVFRENIIVVRIRPRCPFLGTKSVLAVAFYLIVLYPLSLSFQDKLGIIPGSQALIHPTRYPVPQLIDPVNQQTPGSARNPLKFSPAVPMRFTNTPLLIFPSPSHS